MCIRDRLKDDMIVTTVMSNIGLYKACDKIGLHYQQTKVGDKYVFENMMENGYRLGGEQSGHIIFSKHATTGDGILTSLKIMEVLLEKKTTLGTLTSEVQIYPQLLENLRVTDKKAVLEHPEVKKAIAEVTEALGSDGRILVRESGTEPVSYTHLDVYKRQGEESTGSDEADQHGCTAEILPDTLCSEWKFL